MNPILSSFTTEGLHGASLAVGVIIGCAGVAIIFIGSVKAFYLFVRRTLYKDTLLADIRIELGHYLALGLEFLVGSDIIESLADPTWDDLGKLAVLIFLRSVLTFFLGWEVKEVREEMEEERAIRRMKRAMVRKKKG
jgi:uncharacterized membrane protein